MSETDQDRKELADKTHPGFSITCDKCGSTEVIVDSSVGFSAQSGGWGSVDLECLNCGTHAEIWYPR